MIERYYVYAGDRTGHPYLFSPFKFAKTMKPQKFKHGIIDCGYHIIMTEKEYPDGFHGDYMETIQELGAFFGKEKIWFVPPDYPCERDVLGFKETIRERVDKTVSSVENYLDQGLDVTWLIPIQGWVLRDYLYCIEEMSERNIDLSRVGIGTVCKRNKRKPIVNILYGVRKRLNNSWLHAFGLTTRYLEKVIMPINSFDSASYNLWRLQYLGDKARPSDWNDRVRNFYKWKRVVDKKIETHKNQVVLSEFTNKGEE